MRSSIFIVVLFLVSCENNSHLSLSSSDSLVIVFNNAGADDVSKRLSTTDRKAINKLARFVETGKAKEHTCSNEGSLLFYQGSAVLKEIHFAYVKDGCRRFYWEDEKAKHDVKMSNEAADFLKGLAEGQSWY